MNPKMSELRVFLEEYKIDIILIQESKLMQGMNTPHIDGYTPNRADQKDARYPGGGLITITSRKM